VSVATGIAVSVCGLFLALSTATLFGAALLVRRARRAEASARASTDASAKFRAEAERALAEAKRIHANCRASPIGARPFMVGPFGIVRGGAA
jgi:hypothetical protein